MKDMARVYERKILLAVALRKPKCEWLFSASDL